MKMKIFGPSSSEMSRRLINFLVIQALVSKVLTQSQPSLAQYLQLAGLGAYGSTVSSPSPPSYPAPNYPNYLISQNSPKTIIEPPRPSPATSIPLSALSNLASPQVIPPKPPVPKPANSPSSLDSNVLNNLAIALQLLIVSNILSTPPPEIPDSLSKLELHKFALPRHEVPSSHVTLAYPSVSLPASYVESAQPKSFYVDSQLPNSNFLGSSGFVEPSMFGSSITPIRPNPRANMALMSPYEALGPGSPFSDPILSTVYAPSYSKKDFQSPYASILSADGNRDLFSINDLF